MCGITGFNWESENLISDMTKCLSHRGPDNIGQYVNEDISLGHNRLSIIDLSEAGNQPMSARSRYTIIYNGEVYNFDELRSRLLANGYDFKSETDTEVVLYSYIEWGPECVELFNGMFAFAIYDEVKNEIFLARDHLGIKPLFYVEDKDRFIFSSEIESFFVHDLEFQPNQQLIRDFLLYGITDHTTESFFKPISKFPKGSYGIYDLSEQELEIHSWWENEFTGDFEGSYDEAKDRLGTLLERSVERRLVSDVSIGTCLSGGIDSSSIASLINTLSEGADIETFSVVYPGFEFDESEYVETVCRENKLKNYQTTPTAEDLRSDLGNLIRSIGQPIPGPGPYSQYKVFDLAEENSVTVLLDGQGADELFAGYHYFYGFYLAGLLKDKKPITAFREIRGLLSGGDYRTGLLSFGFALSPNIFQQYYLNRNSNISTKLLNEADFETDYLESFTSIDSLHDALKFYLDTRLEHLLSWEDRNSMAHSREARVPFLDKELLDFVFSLPEEYIISDGVTKTILRDAMEGVVPTEILNRRDKIGYGTPEDEWLHEKPIRELLKSWFFESEPDCAEFIDVEQTQNIITNYWNDKDASAGTIWKTFFLEAWLREYWDGDGNIKNRVTADN